ncbi:hypothetical protein CRM22_004656 [Opisthorchis felineus]|uniref:Uncharacterized protein n=1 Tax=Opisthorchis felineus TaxID=147828 RepID=A0A4V3SFA7_OPIFE|nr:hypothetical protein CRM22_004656 [Opisthorchis felineus]
MESNLTVKVMESCKLASKGLVECARLFKRQHLARLQSEAAFSKCSPKFVLVTRVYRLSRLIGVIQELGKRCDQIAQWISQMYEWNRVSTAANLETQNNLGEPMTTCTNGSTAIDEINTHVNEIRFLLNNEDVDLFNTDTRTERISIETLISSVQILVEHVLKQMARFILTLKSPQETTSDKPPPTLFTFEDLLVLESKLPMRYPLEYGKAKAKLVANKNEFLCV